MATDWLSVVVAVVPPWSNSFTSISIVLWLIALVPTLQVTELPRICTTASRRLPVLFFPLVVVGMAWADVQLLTDSKGLESFLKLIAIPLLFFHCVRSPRGSGYCSHSWARSRC